MVDKVLPPSDIADEQIRLSQQVSAFQQTAQNENDAVEDQDLATNDEDLRKIILFLRRSIGVDFTHYQSNDDSSADHPADATLQTGNPGRACRH
jgi:hypothetical protein